MGYTTHPALSLLRTQSLAPSVYGRDVSVSHTLDDFRKIHVRLIKIFPETHRSVAGKMLTAKIRSFQNGLWL